MVMPSVRKEVQMGFGKKGERTAALSSHIGASPSTERLGGSERIKLETAYGVREECESPP